MNHKIKTALWKWKYHQCSLNRHIYYVVDYLRRLSERNHVLHRLKHEK